MNIKNGRRGAAVIALATAAILGTTLASGPASAAPRSESSVGDKAATEETVNLGQKELPKDWKYGPVVQEFIDSYGAERIEQDRRRSDVIEWIEDSSDVADSGYLMAAIDESSGDLQILWNCGAEDQRQRIAEKAKSEGFAVDFFEHPYSWKEVDAQAQAIAAAKDKLLDVGYQLNGVDTLAIGRDSMVVDGMMTDSVAAKSNIAPEELQQNLATEVATIVDGFGDIPVEVKVNNRITATALTTRDTDWPAFSAGGFMRTYLVTPSLTSVCSNGFTLKINDLARTTTARHCRPAVANGTFRAYNLNNAIYGDRDIIGNVTATAALTSQGIGWAFTGGPQTSQVAPVKGMQKVAVNGFVCTSGGNSGVHCNVKVQSTHYLFTGDSSGGNFYAYAAIQIDGQTAAVEGDSGGPVLVPWANGVGAVGILQAAGGPESTCPTRTYVYASEICGTQVLFSDIYTVSADLGGLLVTG